MVSGQADFSMVLVFDVSRWGRFQNVDESAHYEFVCRQEGVEVRYCAEPFEGHDPVSTALLKQVRRVMAGEYSRKLSATVTAAQRRGAAQGYWQAGEAGYGLRRCLVDEARRPVQVLERGQRKALHGQRVILVPGPPEEVATVARIYQLFLEDGLSRAAIARKLQAEGPPYPDGRGWTFQKVHNVLTNPAYGGDNVYGKACYGLDGPARPRPRSEWTVATGAFAPLVAPERLAQAQRRVRSRMLILSDAELLARLAALLRREGRLSSQQINAAPDVPCAATYINRFGSLRTAYAKIGYQPAHRRGAVSRRPGA